VREAEAGVHEAGTLRLDASRVRAELGWRPRLTLETALAWTVAWYRAWQDEADLLEKTNRQIAAYEGLLQGEAGVGGKPVH
jgi:CDP-glucose 4,6-dehydratase